MSRQQGTLKRTGRTWRLVLRELAEPGRPRKQTSIALGSVVELPSRAAARLAADRLVAQRSRDPLHAGRPLRWREWCDRYAGEELPLLATGTAATRRSIIARHLCDAFDTDCVHELDAGRVQAWILDQVRAGAAPATVRARFAALRRVLNAARAAGLAAPLVTARDVRFPRDESPRPSVASKAFTPEEAARILEAATDPDRTAFATMRYCGLRPSECLGLEWQHVDLWAGLIHVRQQAIDGKARVLKSRGSIASLSIPAPLRERLAAFRETWQTSGPGQFLFAGPDGRPWLARDLRARLHELLDQLQIRRRGLHAWRHTCALGLARAGTSPEVIRRCLRHSSLTVTQVYLSAESRDMAEAFERGAHADCFQFATGCDVVAAGIPADRPASDCSLKDKTG
jgi:integrase